MLCEPFAQLVWLQHFDFRTMLEDVHQQFRILAVGHLENVTPGFVEIGALSHLRHLSAAPLDSRLGGTQTRHNKQSKGTSAPLARKCPRAYPH